MTGTTNSGMTLRLGRYVRSKCRPVIWLTFVALVVGLWVVSITIFFHKNYGRVTMSLFKTKHVTEDELGHADPSLDSTHKDVPILRPPANQSESRRVSKEVGGKEWEEEEEFSRRRRRYEQACSQNVKGGVTNPFLYQPAKLAVCVTQKVGCTYWKRIFYFLHNETNGSGVTSPFQIDRFFIHFGPSHKTKTARYQKEKKALIDSFTKVMFTRDPWLRVWSAYVDKLVLPDSWLDHGKAIVRRRRKTTARGSPVCSDDVTFQEFLDYTLNAVDDVHWTPVHHICNPCVFRPHYLGKVETFTKDAEHILRKVGLEKLIEGHDTQRNYSEDEMCMLTNYHFHIYKSREGIRKCLSHSGVAQRLWKAFVLNGYIRDSLTFPAEEFSQALDKIPDSMEASVKATDLLLKYHRALPVLSSQQMRQHRRHIMVQEYRKAPRAHLDKLVSKFKDDFALFAYEARPADIFAS